MAKKIAIPCEFKYSFATGAWTTLFKGYLYAIREKFGAATALEIYETVCKMDDRVKNLTSTLLNVFKIDGNDTETIGEWWDIYWASAGFEGAWLERSKTIARAKIIKCPFKPAYRDLSDICLIFCNIVAKSINPAATFELPKAMCKGDPHCEYMFKLPNEQD